MFAVLWPSGGARAATGSAQSPSVPGCRGLNYRIITYNDSANGYIGAGNDLYFDHSGNSDIFCSAPISSGSSIVELLDISKGGTSCLALNSSSGAIYLHSASACNAGTASYLRWKIMSIGSDRDGTYVALENQYPPLGLFCLYDNIQSDPAITDSCSRDGFDQFLWFRTVA